MAKEKEYVGPYEVRGRKTAGATDELLSVHNDPQASITAAEEAVHQHGYEQVTVIDRPTQAAVHTVQREAPPA